MKLNKWIAWLYNFKLWKQGNKKKIRIPKDKWPNDCY